MEKKKISNIIHEYQKNTIKILQENEQAVYIKLIMAQQIIKKEKYMPPVRHVVTWFIKRTSIHEWYLKFTNMGYLKRIGAGNKNTKYEIIWDKKEALKYWKTISLLDIEGITDTEKLFFKYLYNMRNRNYINLWIDRRR